VRQARGPSGQSPRGREHVPAPRGIAGQGARGQTVHLFGRGKAQRNACRGAQRLIKALSVNCCNSTRCSPTGGSWGRVPSAASRPRIETLRPLHAQLAQTRAGVAAGSVGGVDVNGLPPGKRLPADPFGGELTQSVDDCHPVHQIAPEQTQRRAGSEVPAVNAKAGPAAKRRLCHRDAEKDEQMPNGWRHLVDWVPRRARATAPARRKAPTRPGGTGEW